MSRRKLWNTAWKIVFIYSLFLQFALARPSIESVQSDTGTTKIELDTKPTESAIRPSTDKKIATSAITPASTNSPRDVKNVTPIIGESIKMVASQLLHSTKAPSDIPVVEDTRTPPKIKNLTKTKTKPKPETTEIVIENSHAGIAVPVTIEELEKGVYNHDHSKETSTSNEGISTWILLSNPSSTTKSPKGGNKPENETSYEEPQKKPKPNQKNKPKKPQPNQNKPTVSKRPIIASTNKSDLVAGGSAINENMFNKIKATVLANVQKNKNAANRTATTTTTETSVAMTLTTIRPVSKKDITTKTSNTGAVVAANVTVKTTKAKKKKKKNKNKTKIQSAIYKESALLPMEAKEQEIELEVSTPPMTTKKPKRNSTKRKKNKSKSKTPSSTSIKSDVSETTSSKTSNATKPSKQPTKTNPISTQIYNYLSREVMPTVGVSIVGLAGLVGLASYFLYPFASPVRRVFEVDKKDDLYRHNAEEYAHDGNGQPEEEMLGTVLAGMPAKTNRVNSVNPYANQTPVRQQQAIKKESDQNLRYRHVSSHSDVNSYNAHYSQSKTGIAHGAIYSDPISFSTRYESNNAYKPENKQAVYPNEDQNTYNSNSNMESNVYSPVEPIYAEQQTGPSGPTSYGSDTSNTVLYGVKSNQDSSFQPVYPFEGQVFSETTSYPMTYPPTSMYLGSNSDSESSKDSSYNSGNQNNDKKEPQFVVGNVPEELIQTVTPAVVPEHGPRKLRKKRGLVESLEEILKKAKEENKDGFISNEIDEALGIKPEDNVPLPTKDTAYFESLSTLLPKSEIHSTYTPVETKSREDLKNEKSTPLYPVYTVSSEEILNKTNIVQTSQSSISTPATKSEYEIVESISTMPIENKKEENPITTEANSANDIYYTTQFFRVYEVFPTSDDIQSSTLKTDVIENPEPNLSTIHPVIEEDYKPNLSSTDMPPTEFVASSTIIPKTQKPLKYSTPYYNTPTQGLKYPKTSVFQFIKDLFEFKFKLGMSVLQATSDSLTRYLRSMDGTVQRMAKASQPQE